MKRSDIIKQLMNEGFSSKTLVNFSDKQLLSLSSRINESLTVSQKTLDTDQNVKNKVSNIAKTSDVEILPEEGEMPGLKAKKEVKETGVPGLKAKVVKETGVPGLKAKEVKETGVPGLKAKVVKETGVPGLKAKSGGEKLGCGTVKEEGPMPGLKAKKEVKEAAGAMPGLTVKGKSNTPKQESKPKKEVGEEESVEKKEKTNNKVEKKDGKDKHEAFIEKLKNKKKKDSSSINEWVDDVAKKHYHPFTTKDDIMEMIMTKLNEIGEEQEMVKENTPKLPEFLTFKSIKGSGAAPAPAVPKTKPGTKTPPKQNPTQRPKTPYQPGPGTNPRPKARMSAIAENEPVTKTKVPVINPGKKG